MEVTKDTNHETHILPREKNTSTYIFTLTIPYLHHNPLPPFIGSICLYIHCHILNTNIINIFPATNNKLKKEKHN
jgi:hypothetical protein